MKANVKTRLLRTAAAAAIITALLASLCGCGSKRITDEAAMPLQRAIDGVLEADVNEYLSAFPPDYVEIITEEYERSVCEDFTAYMQEYLSSALETHEVNLGGHTEIYFELQSKEALPDDQLDKYYDGYVDYNVIQYTPDTSAITGQYMIKGTLFRSGDESGTSADASFFVIEYNGQWYLHPISFFSVFN